ncbi:hypothetical protein FF38_01483 [Lucilia cuprina]|uniref:Uncharacterized protein n=1 Tax=Lucilia cuprina TaxID=7375 RepID=A0A0L0BQ74_LUCCU|nr:hypothetical protein FF38_01483 [Lucilia cuprina]
MGSVDLCKPVHEYACDDWFLLYQTEIKNQVESKHSNFKIKLESYARIPAFKEDYSKLVTDINQFKEGYSTELDYSEEINTLINKLPLIPNTIEQQTPSKLAKINQACTSEAFKAAHLLTTLAELDQPSSVEELDKIKNSLSKCHLYFKKKHKECMNAVEYLRTCFSQFNEYFTILPQALTHLHSNLQKVEYQYLNFQELSSDLDNASKLMDKEIDNHERIQLSIRAWDAEVSRRQTTEKQLQQLIVKANQALNNHYTTEKSLRQDFIDQHSKYLPEDILFMAKEMPSKYATSSTNN